MICTAKAVGIDNSALSQVTSNPKMAQDFGACLHTQGAYLYVPFTTVQELLNTAMPYREQTLEDLGRFTHLLGARFKITRPLDAIFTEEIGHNICHQPSISSRAIQGVRTILENSPKGGRARHFETTELGKEKDKLYALDKKLMKDATEQFEAQNVAELLSGYARPNTSNIWLEAMSSRHHDLSVSSVIENPTRYPALFLWAVMGDLYSIGLAIDPEHRKKSREPALKGLGRDRGSHHDNRVFAECAYCDTFVVQDRLFAKRARLAKEKGTHSIEVCTVDEFLDTALSRPPEPTRT